MGTGEGYHLLGIFPKIFRTTCGMLAEHSKATMARVFWIHSSILAALAKDLYNYFFKNLWVMYAFYTFVKYCFLPVHALSWVMFTLGYK